MTDRLGGETFFRTMAILVLVIVVAGFGLLRITRWETMPIPTIWVMLHGTTALAWCSFAVLQTRLIRARSFKTHMKLGGLGFVIAMAALAFGVIVTLSAAARNIAADSLGIAAAETASQMVDFLSFGAAFLLGFTKTKKPQTHKRLMLASAIFMVPPAAFRLMVVAGLPVPLTLAVLLGLALAMLIYDWRKLGKPHWVSWMVLGVFVIGTPIKILLPSVPAWQELLVTTLG